MFVIILILFQSLTSAETVGSQSALAQRMSVPSYNPQDYRHVGWLPRDNNLRNVYIKLYEANQVNQNALRNAFQYYEQNSCTYNSSSCCLPLNPNTMAIADFTKSSMDDRLSLINLRTGTITLQTQTSHGARSGGQRAPASSFSNANGSHQTPAGFHMARGVYTGSNGLSLNLHGLEDRNNNSYRRRIVIHAAQYVAAGGRSHGCLAVEPNQIRSVVDLLKDDALVYNFNGESSIPAAQRQRSCPR